MQLLQRLGYAAPTAAVAVKVALAPGSDATLATLRQACDSAGDVVDAVRRTAVLLASDVTARCASSALQRTGTVTPGLGAMLDRRSYTQ